MDKVFELKPGVVWKDMSVEFEWDLSRWMQVADFIRNVCGGVPTITSARDGKHSINSLHSEGAALDIRIKDWKEHFYAESYCKTIAWLLGKKWVVVLEDTHIHCQLGTRNIRNPEHIQKIGNGNYLR